MDKTKKIDHAADIEALVREIREFVWAKVDEVISHVLEIQNLEDDSITTNDDEQED